MSVHKAFAHSARSTPPRGTGGSAWPGPPVAAIDVSTDDVAPSVRIDFWQQILTERFGVPELRYRRDDARSFAGRVVGLELGAVKVHRVTAGRAEVARASPAPSSAGAEEFHVEVPLRGVAALTQGGREAVLRPGDFALCDNSSPFHYGFRSSFDELVIQVPRATLLAAEPRLDRLTAVAIGGDTGLGALVSSLLRQAADLDGWSSSPAATAFLATLVDLVLSALCDRLGPPERPLARSRYLADARAYVLDNLADSDLSLERVASAVGISLRYLHALFRNEGTTASRWILGRRLERSRLLLADARHANLSVTQVAAAVGFVDVSHFCRLFKAASGVTPSAYRRARLGLPPALAPR